MNKINLSWKYWLVALGVIAVCACSEDTELAKVADKHQELQNATRTASWYTKEVTLEDIGQLSSKVTEAMAGEDLNMLEKLVVSGPIAENDMAFLRGLMFSLKSLDLKNATIKSSDTNYYDPYSGYRELQDDSICSYMFSYSSALKEIQLPSNILYIGRNAFYSCDSLTSIVIPDGVKLIEEETFANCRSLSSVTMSSNIEEIKYHAFYECDTLKTVSMPDKVKYIGDGAFYSCNLLSSVEFSSDSKLDSIACWAFSYTGLKSIKIPDQVKYIDDNAFRNCNSLSSVILSSNLEELEWEAFYNCDSLKSIIIPDKVKFLGERAFYSCNMLSSVEFAENSALDSIAGEAFCDTNLKSIVIPNTVRTIGGSTFSSCDSLLNVVLPANLMELGEWAFYNCYSLKTIDIPNGVTEIKERTFGGCGSLSSVTFPASLEEIRGYAFSYCALTSIELPSTLKNLHGCAFEYCRTLTSIDLPEGVEHIGGHTFYDCDGLTELTIPSTVTSIEEGFSNSCDNLHTIIWKAPIDVPYCWGSNDCLFFVETDQDVAVNECWSNVIRNGVAEFPVTIQASNNQFRILKEFTAPEVTYTRYFGDETIPGTSSGWQTIVLPFTPDSIYHESKGRVAPFNSELADGEEYKPFWLRELSADGFVDVTSITPDKAYLIAMPNHNDYMDEYRLNGTITFKAKNVTLVKTQDELEASVGPDFEFHPTYDFVKKALYVYALHSKYGWYGDKDYSYYKSFFIRSASDIYPFNAYVTAPGGGRSSRAEFDLDTRSKATRGVPYKPNTSGIPQIGDM